MVKLGEVFLFVGAHDECDTWVMNNRDIDPDQDQAEIVRCPENRAAPEGNEVPADSAKVMDDDRPLHEVIDQQTLREIFSGLCQRARCIFLMRTTSMRISTLIQASYRESGYGG